VHVALLFAVISRLYYVLRLPLHPHALPRSDATVRSIERCYTHRYRVPACWVATDFAHVADHCTIFFATVATFCRYLRVRYRYRWVMRSVSLLFFPLRCHTVTALGTFVAVILLLPHTHLLRFVYRVSFCLL